MVKKPSKHLVKKAAKFGGVGVLNTIIDYAIFNALLLGLGVKPFYANLVSTTAALSFSYFMNKRFVFKHAGAFDVRSAVLFLAFTAFGLWVIQGFGLALIIHWIQTNYPALYANHEFIVVNSAKLVASVGSIIWNFATYNSIVFKHQPETQDAEAKH